MVGPAGLEPATSRLSGVRCESGSVVSAVLSPGAGHIGPVRDRDSCQRLDKRLDRLGFKIHPAKWLAGASPSGPRLPHRSQGSRGVRVTPTMGLFYARSRHSAIGHLPPVEYETMLEEQAQAAIAV